MVREFAIAHDAVVLISNIISIMICALIYQITKSKGFFVFLLGYVYILLVRTLSLYYSIVENSADKATLSSCVVGFWILSTIGLFIFYFEIKRIIK
jgi:hypothetical protein